MLIEDSVAIPLSETRGVIYQMLKNRMSSEIWKQDWFKTGFMIKIVFVATAVK